MNTWIRIHQNDAGIILAFTCRDEIGNPVDLTQMSVDFTLRSNGSVINTDHAQCTKSNAELGLAEYTIHPADTSSAGLLQGVLTLRNGTSQVRHVDEIPIEVAAP